MLSVKVSIVSGKFYWLVRAKWLRSWISLRLLPLFSTTPQISAPPLLVARNEYLFISKPFMPRKLEMQLVSLLLIWRSNNFLKRLKWLVSLSRVALRRSFLGAYRSIRLWDCNLRPLLSYSRKRFRISLSISVWFCLGTGTILAIKFQSFLSIIMTHLNRALLEFVPQ